MDATKLDLPALILPNSKQFRETCMSQEFPFTSPIMRYILITSREVNQKLIKCCKIFSIKNPILVFKNLFNSDISGWKYCPHLCRSNVCLEREKIDWNKISGKVWLTERLCFLNINLSKIPSPFFSLIYRYEVKYLRFRRVCLSDVELRFFSTGLEEFSLNKCVIQYETGEKLLEEIVKFSSGCKRLFMTSHHDNATRKSFSNLIAACQAIENVKFFDMPNNFDKNKNRTKIFICFEYTIFTNDVLNIIEEILNTDTFGFVPPVVNDFMDPTICKRMIHIQEREALKLFS